MGLGVAAGLVAGLWLGQAFGVFLLPGFGVSSSSPQVPRHPTSMCDAGVNIYFREFTPSLINLVQRLGCKLQKVTSKDQKYLTG